MPQDREYPSKIGHAEPIEGNQLRWIADAYEQAQRIRIQTGEKIRAAVRTREQSTDSEGPPSTDTARLLQQIRSGVTDGPLPLLGRTYRRHWEAERELASGMEDALSRHPAWPWLSAVRGVGSTLAAKLLARLNVRRADTPSAFWAFCGLATVPGTEYRCDVCGLTTAYPEHYNISGTHLRLGSKRRCTGELLRTRGADEGVRVAQPRSVRGQPSAYDQYAKKVCYLVGTSFLKAGGRYGEFYRREKEKLERQRPGWSASRRHLTALRKTEKLFLAHLWLVWRQAEGLPVTEQYSARHGVEIIDPWSMIDVGPRRSSAGQQSDAGSPPASDPDPPRRPRPGRSLA